MICERCKQHEATTTVKQTINGESHMINLCPYCANSVFLNQFFSDFNIHNLFANNLSSGTQNRKECDNCHTTLQQIAKSGKIGCAHCYDVFGQELSRTIEKIHGKSVHNGKIPNSAKGTIKVKNLLTQYRTELSRLVSLQEFEKAAEVRDKIKQLEEEGENE